MKNYRETVWRLIILFVGLTIAHLGVTMFLLADLGADPFNVLVQGLFKQLSAFTGWAFLTHGRVHIAVCFVIILVLLIVDRSYIKLGTIVCMVFGGPIIDFFTLLLSPLFEAVDSFMRYSGGSAGRAAHKKAREAMETATLCRSLAARLIGAENPE